MRDRSTRTQIQREEAFCDIIPTDAHGRAQKPRDHSLFYEKQLNTMRHLATIYEEGGEHVFRNTRKAQLYRFKYRQLHQFVYEKEATDLPEPDGKANPYDEMYKSMCKDAGNHIRNIGFFYWLASLYNEWRIYFLCIGLILKDLGIFLLPIWYGVLSLMYGPQFIVDGIIQLKNTFTTKRTPKEEGIPYWTLVKQRFVSSIFDGNRLSRMINDGLWFGINFATLGLLHFVSPIVSSIINAAGFFFDMCHVAVKSVINTLFFRSYKNVVEKDLAQNKADKATLKRDPDIQTPDKEERLKQLKREKHALRDEYEGINAEYESSKVRNSYNFFRISMLLVGIGMFIFPFPPVHIIGGIILTGAILWGLSQRIYDITNTVNNIFHAYHKPKLNKPAVKLSTEAVLQPNLVEQAQPQVVAPVPVPAAVQLEAPASENPPREKAPINLMDFDMAPTQEINLVQAESAPALPTFASGQDKIYQEPKKDVFTLWKSYEMAAQVTRMREKKKLAPKHSRNVEPEADIGLIKRSVKVKVV
jgi:hypothetical protein